MDLEKHVQDLELLPNKWHIDFGPKEQTSRPAGCTSSQVCDISVACYALGGEGTAGVENTVHCEGGRTVEVEGLCSAEWEEHCGGGGNVYTARVEA